MCPFFFFFPSHLQYLFLLVFRIGVIRLKKKKKLCEKKIEIITIYLFDLIFLRYIERWIIESVCVIIQTTGNAFNWTDTLRVLVSPTTYSYCAWKITLPLAVAYLLVKSILRKSRGLRVQPPTHLRVLYALTHVRCSVNCRAAPNSVTIFVVSIGKEIISG